VTPRSDRLVEAVALAQIDQRRFQQFESAAVVLAGFANSFGTDLLAGDVSTTFAVDDGSSSE